MGHVDIQEAFARCQEALGISLSEILAVSKKRNITDNLVMEVIMEATDRDSAIVCLKKVGLS